MVLEKDLKLPQNQHPSEAVFEEIEDNTDRFAGTHQQLNFNSGNALVAPHMPPSVPQRNAAPSTSRKKIQLTFENVQISAIPKQKRCGKKGQPQVKPKTILNDVSGTIQPGQFLAIIGASGMPPSSLLIPFRCWKDHTT